MQCRIKLGETVPMLSGCVHICYKYAANWRYEMFNCDALLPSWYFGGFSISALHQTCKLFVHLGVMGRAKATRSHKECKNSEWCVCARSGDKEWKCMLGAIDTTSWCLADSDQVLDMKKTSWLFGGRIEVLTKSKEHSENGVTKGVGPTESNQEDEEEDK